MGTHKKNRLGEKFKSNQGYDFMIVEYNGCNDVWIEFQDKHKAKIHTSYANCQKGEVKNPYHPSLINIGYLGLTKDGNKPKASDKGKDTREYKVWSNMIHRCYSNECQSYKDATVCERWLCFANFLEDLPLIEGYELWRDNPNQRIALDKDIKGNGSKIYCLENCKFVSCSDNAYEEINRCGSPFGESVRVYGVNIETGEKTKTYDSINEVAREFNLQIANIHKCLSGTRNHTGGYKWYRID